MPLFLAQRNLPVVADGVVTDTSGWPYGITVQDESDAVYVGLAPGASQVAVGQRVRVHGTTNEGRFAPIILAGRIEILGEGTLPAPYFAKARELASGDLDNRRVEVRGVVRATTGGALGDSRAVFMVVDMNPGTVHVALSRSIQLDVSKYVDATIRASGVVAVEFNQRRQALGASVAVNRAEDIGILRAPSGKALVGPPTSISSIFQWGSGKDWTHRIKVGGVLTLQRPREFLILQDGDQAIRVDSFSSAPLPLGARFEAAGFAIPAGFGPVLTDAVIGATGSSQPVEPAFRRADDISLGDDNWLLIKLRAKLIESHESGKGLSLLLEDGKTRFVADVPGSAARELERIAPGSQLEVTGVDEVMIDALRRASGFRLLLRSPGDVTVLSSGPRLKMSDILWAALALALLAMLCGAWALALRARVRSQTAWIAESLAREKADASLHAVRSRVLGLIGRNVSLRQVCEEVVEVLSARGEATRAAIGVCLADRWEWIGGPVEYSETAIDKPIELASSSGALRVRVILPPEGASLELQEMCRECLSIAIEHHELHERLVRQSLSDPLTQLPNRRSLDGHLDRVLATASVKRTRCAIMVIDMDGFKAVNDTLGHAAGDVVLQRLAQRFTAAVRPNDVVARLGGDEFVAVLENVTGAAEAEEIARRLASEASYPIDVAGIEIRPSLSIGMALYPADGDCAQSLKEKADTRMYQWKMSRSEQHFRPELLLQA